MAHEVADAITTDPRIGAFRSPMTSSRENSTAAMGVLNAAARAAAAPTGSSAFVFSGLNRSQRASTEAMPEPICTDGLSRPSAMPLARDAEEQKNFPITVRNEIV